MTLNLEELLEAVQPPPDEALLRWLEYPIPAEPETLVTEVLTGLGLRKGVTLLHLYCGRSPVQLHLTPGIYYEGIDPDATLQALSRVILPHARLTAAPIASYLYGEPVNRYDLIWATVPLDPPIVLGGQPHLEAFYFQEEVTPADIVVELATKVLRPGGTIVLAHREPLTETQASRIGVPSQVFAQDGWTLSVYGNSRGAGAPLQPVPAANQDPGPFRVVRPVDRFVKLPPWASETVVDREDQSIGLRFANCESAAEWAHELLRTQPDRTWDEAVRYWRSMMRVDRFARLKAAGEAGYAGTLPAAPALQKHLDRLSRKQARQQLSYPDNCRPEHRYWTIGPGATVMQGETTYKVKNVVVDPEGGSPPKLFLEEVVSA